MLFRLFGGLTRIMTIISVIICHSLSWFVGFLASLLVSGLLIFRTGKDRLCVKYRSLPEAKAQETYLDHMHKISSLHVFQDQIEFIHFGVIHDFV